VVSDLDVSLLPLVPSSSVLEAPAPSRFAAVRPLQLIHTS
jgi:hypothetical protein